LYEHEEEDCQSVSDSEQEDSEHESDLEQQPGSRYDSQLESGSSTFADFSMDMNAYQSYDQIPEHFEHIAVADCIDNCMFLVDHSYDVLNLAAHLSCDHSYEEETTNVDDQELVSKEQEGNLFTSKEIFAEEHPGLLKQPGFCHSIHDPVAIYMESYISDFLKCSNCISSPILTGEYGVMKDFQDHTIEPFPLLIKEKHRVEINYPGPAEDTEQHVKEELSGQFISCPEPVSEQPSSEVSQPASTSHPPALARDIQPCMSSCGIEQSFCYKFSGVCHSFYEPVGEYMQSHFLHDSKPPGLIPLLLSGGKLKDVIILLSRLFHVLLIIDRVNKLAARKLLEWLWWKFSFT
jgi:hypothetical protein